MAKRKRKVITHNQAWAQSRNRAKGQIGYMLGTLESVKSLEILSEKELPKIATIRRILVDLKKNWEDQNSNSRQQFLDTWDQKGRSMADKKSEDLIKEEVEEFGVRLPNTVRFTLITEQGHLITFNNDRDLPREEINGSNWDIKISYRNTLTVKEIEEFGDLIKDCVAIVNKVL